MSQHLDAPNGEPPRAQILHCDIKSGNILLGRGGVAKIAGAPRAPPRAACMSCPAQPCLSTSAVAPGASCRRSLFLALASRCGGQSVARASGAGAEADAPRAADVGLAKLLSSAQTMASAVGTFDWAAPGILAGAPVRRAWDAGAHAHACGVIGGRRVPASPATVLKCLDASAERVSDARCPAGEPCNEKADIYRWACAPLMFVTES